MRKSRDRRGFVVLTRLLSAQPRTTDSRHASKRELRVEAGHRESAYPCGRSASRSRIRRGDTAYISRNNRASSLETPTGGGGE